MKFLHSNFLESTLPLYDCAPCVKGVPGRRGGGGGGGVVSYTISARESEVEAICQIIQLLAINRTAHLETTEPF